MNITGIIIMVCLIILLCIKLFMYIRNENNVIDVFKQSEDLIGNGQIRGSRKKQEDSFSTIKRDDKILAVLADGMGGLFSGKMASKLATKTYIENFTRTYDIDSVNKFLINNAYIINEKILNKIEDRRIGTTLIAVFIDGDKCYWISIGDSSLYFFKDGVI